MKYDIGDLCYHLLTRFIFSPSSFLAPQPCVGLGLLSSFATVKSSGVGLSGPCPNPNLEHQGLHSGPYCLTSLVRVALPETYAPASTVHLSLKWDIHV
jgi:hypothetical protein